ncbi:MAG: VC0807 family protein [Streptosporangiaceae bacterium]
MIRRPQATLAPAADQAPAAGGGDRSAEPARPARQVAQLVVDIAAPVGLYYALHAAGASNLVALSVGAIPPAAGAVWSVATRRRADPVALLVLVTIVISVCLSVVVRDPRFLLARDGLVTGVWSAWFLASARTGRPAALVFARPLMEGRRVFAAGSWDGLWAESAAFRRIWRTSTVIWAAALLADAVARVVMAYALPVTVVPGLSGALWPVTFLVIQIVTNIYYTRAGLYRILGARWLDRPRRS